MRRTSVFLLSAFLFTGMVAPHRSEAACLFRVVSTIAPTDGGSAVAPALITPSTDGVPATVRSGGTAEPVSNLLVLDDGTTPNCFTTGQSFRFTYSVAISSPTSLSASNFDVYDVVASGGLALQGSISTAPNNNGQLQSTVTVNVIQGGFPGNITTGYNGSGFRLKGLAIKATSLVPGNLVTVVPAVGFGLVTVDSLTVGKVMRVGPVTLDTSMVNFGLTYPGQTKAPAVITVGNVGETPIAISNLAVTGDFVWNSDCPSTLPAAKACKVTIAFAPTRFESVAGQLIVTDNALNSPQTAAVIGTAARVGFRSPKTYSGLGAITAIGDFNGDGHDDVEVASFSGTGTKLTTTFTFLDGAKGFAPGPTFTMGGYLYSPISADLNHDGKLDLIVPTAVVFAGPVQTVLSLLGNGDGSFKIGPSYPAPVQDVWSTPILADVNGDKNPDLVICSALLKDGKLTVGIMLGDGNGGFQAATTFNVATSVKAVRDFNHDGKDDLLIGNSVYLSNGDGTFGSALPFYTGTDGSSQTEVGDFDGDGNLDLVSAFFGSNKLRFFRGNGDGTFQPPVDINVLSDTYGTSLVSIQVIKGADFDGDGKLDLAVYHANAQQSWYRYDFDLLLGKGDGTFEAPLPMGISDWSATSYLIGDFDGDGRVDLLTIGQNSLTLISNSTPMAPRSGWWWDPKLNGTGYFIEYGGKSGQGLFIGGFLYDTSGNNIWLVSTGPLSGDTYNSTWLKASGGQTLLGPYKSPGQQTVANVSLLFLDSTHAVMTRPDGTKINLQRFSFSSTQTPAPPVAGAPQSGWWWAGSAFSGTGYGVEVQGNAVFVVAYVYDDAGNPVWYLATGALTTPTSYTGTWDVYAGGPQLSSPEGTYSAHQVAGASVPMSLTFSDPTHGALTMGNVVIPIVRFQEF